MDANIDFIYQCISNDGNAVVDIENNRGNKVFDRIDTPSILRDLDISYYGVYRGKYANILYVVLDIAESEVEDLEGVWPESE